MKNNVRTPVGARVLAVLPGHQGHRHDGYIFGVFNRTELTPFDSLSDKLGKQSKTGGERISEK